MNKFIIKTNKGYVCEKSTSGFTNDITEATTFFDGIANINITKIEVIQPEYISNIIQVQPDYNLAINVNRGE